MTETIIGGTMKKEPSNYYQERIQEFKHWAKNITPDEVKDDPMGLIRAAFLDGYDSGYDEAKITKKPKGK